MRLDRYVPKREPPVSDPSAQPEPSAVPSPDVSPTPETSAAPAPADQQTFPGQPAPAPVPTGGPVPAGDPLGSADPSTQPLPGQPFPDQPFPDQPFPGQPAPGQPFPGQPGMVAPAGTQKSGSRGLIIGLVIGVVALLLLCGIGTTAFVVTMKSDDPPRSDSATAATSASPEASSSFPGAEATVTFASPEQIGVWKKAEEQSQAQPMLEQMRTAGLEQPFAVVYRNTSVPGQAALLWGGTGKMFSVIGNDAGLDSIFKQMPALLGGESLGTRTDVPTGALKGKMECAATDGMGIAMTLCIWAGPGGLLAMMFTGADQATGAQQAQAVLPAVVTKS